MIRLFFFKERRISLVFPSQEGLEGVHVTSSLTVPSLPPQWAKSLRSLGDGTVDTQGTGSKGTLFPVPVLSPC